MTRTSFAGSEAAGVLEEPQAQSANTQTRARRIAISFFIFNILL